MPHTFPKIDLHCHILPKSLPNLKERFGYGDWVHVDYSCTHDGKAVMYKGDAFFREVDLNCYDPLARIRDCDRDGVSVQVLSTVPVYFSYWAKPEDALEVCRMINDDLHAVVKTNPRRFIGLGCVPLQNTEFAVRELERCVTVLGFPGVEIGTHVDGINLSDPKLFPFFEAADRLGACIFVHPWDMMGFDSMEKYWLPWLVGMPAETSRAICSLIFGGVFEKLPNLRFAFAHGGGSFPATIGRIEHGFDVRPDLCAVDNAFGPRKYAGTFWLDSLVHEENALKTIVDLVGVDKVVLGSDYPFPLGEHCPGRLVESASFLSEEDKHRVLWDNCFQFLGLDDKDFV